MFSWLYYNEEEMKIAEKNMIFLMDKKCRILSSPNFTESEKKIKIDRIKFILDCIHYKYGI